MDLIDRNLMDLMQGDFPLVKTPFKELGWKLGIGQEEVIARVKNLSDAEIIRQIGPIYSSKHIGYHSTLAAFSVKPERLQSVADAISSLKGVSHNYARDYKYNLWFTLTLPKHKDLKNEIIKLSEALLIEKFLYLPALRTFRLVVHFDMSKNGVADPKQTLNTLVEREALSDFEKMVICLTQGQLPLIVNPFAPAADALGVSQDELLGILKRFKQQGIMRRFSAVLRHRKAGFSANGMGCWVIPEERINSAGKAAAEFRFVSHCYHRPAYPPEWPYTLFTMVHGSHRSKVEKMIENIKKEINCDDYIILYSTKEFKKERVRYYDDEC